MGRSVSMRAQRTILGTAAKMARGAGVTPWTILPPYGRLSRRGVDCGALAVFTLGPKDARIDIERCALFEMRFAAFFWISPGCSAGRRTSKK